MNKLIPCIEIASSFDDGVEIEKLLAKEFNVLIFKEKMTKLVGALDEKGIRNLSACMCVATFSLAQRYERAKARGMELDLRYTNACVSASAIWVPVAKQLYAMTGISLGGADEESLGYIYSFKDDGDVGFVTGFLSAWDVEHPTLKQAIFGSCVREADQLLIGEQNKNKIWQYLNKRDTSFPFI